jgi:hypothetical protein
VRRPQLFGKTLFVDFLMSNVAVLLSLVLLIDFSHKQKEKKQEQQSHLATDGLYAVVMTWPDGSDDDVDLYVRDPLGQIAFFQGRDAGLMHLENDDLGSRSDTLTTAGGTVKVDKNEERVIIRGAVPGEYVVNAQMYSKRSPGPTPVTVKLYRLSGNDTEVKSVTRTLLHDGDESTAFRFSLDQGGDVTGYNDLRMSLVGPAANAPQQPQGGMSVPGGF